MSRLPLTARMRKCVDTLREEEDPGMPVEVVRGRLRGAYAECECDGERFIITVDSRLRGSLAIYFLLHEWAHAVSWDTGEDDHAEPWGVSYARIYRMALERSLL